MVSPTGKKDFQVEGVDLVRRLTALFDRPENSQLEPDEMRILAGARCPSFLNSDLSNIERWHQLPFSYRKFFPRSLKRLLSNWGKNCDLARYNVAAHRSTLSSLSDPKNSRTVIVTPRLYFEGVPELVPNSETVAQSEFQIFLQRLAKTISKGSLDRFVARAKPIGLRAQDQALVLRADALFSASFIMDNFKTQIDHAAGSRKIVICA
jgi:hypothetical protein